MDETAVNLEALSSPERPWPRVFLVAVVVVVLALAGWQVFRARQTGPVISDQIRANTITASELAERHGLAVRLIGVTAGGGMIDFRLKILDAGKAQTFLENAANLPRLIAADSAVELMAPEGLDDDIEWSENAILFNMYPNDGSVIKAGSPVIVKFGDFYLEPMPAQ